MFCLADQLTVGLCTGKIGFRGATHLCTGLEAYNASCLHVSVFSTSTTVLGLMRHSFVLLASLGSLMAKYRYELQVEPALPSERYLKILQKGAKQHNLSAEYQVYLQALQHYQPSSRGQLAGRWVVLNTFGRPLKFFLLRIMPNVKNPFATWLTHEVLANYILVMWWLHDCIMEPALGSGRHH